MEAQNKVDALQKNTERDTNYKLKAGAFLGLIGIMSTLYGFSRTLNKAKKTESKMIEEGGRKAMILMDEGSMLALRALGWGTLYAVLGTATFCFGVWKLSGANNIEEFRMKMGRGLPKLSKDGIPTSRTDFESLTDLMKYLATWGRE